MIANICILYARDYDNFHIISDQDQASNKNKCLTRVRKKQLQSCCSYGNIEISSQSDAVCQWDIKMLKLKSLIIIGITSSSSPNKTIFQQKDGHHYAIFNDSWKYKETANMFHKDSSLPRFNEGDIVSICLNLKKGNGELSMTVNNRNKYNVYSNVKRGQDISYRLMVVLHTMHDSVEITSFTK